MTGLVEVPVQRIADYVDPFGCPPWASCAPFTPGDVLAAVAADHLASQPIPDWAPGDAHVERIAWFVVNGWDPAEESVEIDVGCPGIGTWAHDWWPVLDGNHRVCAAIVRGDETIACNLSGSWDEIREVLGVDLAAVSA